MRERSWTARALTLALLVGGLATLHPGVAEAQDDDLGDLGGDLDVGAEGGDAAPTPASATATTDPTERARQEFAAGVACVEEHETACAERHFRTALGLRDAPAIRYNLASALYELGRYPEAARHVAVVLADPATPAEIRGPAETLQQQLRDGGGTLAIRLSGATDGAEVTVDGDPVPQSALESTLVRAGAHRVEVTRRGQVAASEEVTVTAGATQEVALVVAPTPEEIALEGGSEEPSPAGGEPGLVEDWRFWAVVGGAVVAIAIIVIAVVVANENAAVEAPIEGNFNPGVLRWD